MQIKKTEVEDSLQNKVDLFFQNKKPNMAEHLGIEFTKLATGEVKGTMPVDSRTHQPFGVLHGGASVAFAETLASVGAWLTCDVSRQTAVGMEINANHVRPVQEGSVTGHAESLHRGSQTQIWQVTIRNNQQKLVCVSRCTLAIVPLNPQT